ncbi:MAG: hypothetical protein AAF802_15860, partial [Planctomycetota bacterium]
MPKLGIPNRRLLGLVIRWLFGGTIGTLLVAVTSPLFVRNYPPRIYSQQRQSVVNEPGSIYRWRGEGYATSRIGAMGVVGAQPPDTKLSPDTLRVAFWGDSQAEGVCVPDRDKIAAQTERAFASQQRAGAKLFVRSFARSGDDCNDWIRQIASLGSTNAYPCDFQVFLITEWSDWCRDVETTVEVITPTEDFAARHVPAFIIQAIRNATTIDASGTARTLRWSVGPVAKRTSASVTNVDESETRSRAAELLSVQVARLGAATADAEDVPRIVFLYAPLAPSITGGE